MERIDVETKFGTREVWEVVSAGEHADMVAVVSSAFSTVILILSPPRTRRYCCQYVNDRLDESAAAVLRHNHQALTGAAKSMHV
jgi:hypothetical protein